MRADWPLAGIRIGLVVLLAVIAACMRPFEFGIAISAAGGAAVGGAIVALEIFLRRATLRTLIGGGAGMLIGMLLGLLLATALDQANVLRSSAAIFFRIAIPLAGAYIGILAGLANASSLDLRMLGLSALDRTERHEKILDTSVLIDGRIADIAEAGFLDGTAIIPQFVLHELQFVADSADSARRARGRRGLDVVQKLQKLPHLQVEVSNQDFPAQRQVDLKLIELAKLRKAKIVTNDFNLNKLAQVQGLQVLNINELANALKPVVLPGEAMRVFILKEGKEYNQGVAYLDDGTMVVVDNARRHISKTIDITVTSVLQTTAGKMIFGRYDERAHGESRSSHGSLPAATGTQNI